MPEYKSNPDNKNDVLFKSLLVIIIISGIGLFWYFDLGNYLSLNSLKTHRDSLLTYTESNFTFALFIYLLIYILQTALLLPGGALLTLLGGFLFGSLMGTLLVNIGATMGATLAFLSARYLLSDWVENKFGNRLSTIQHGFSNNAFGYLLTLRLIPAFPFFLINLVSGITRIKTSTYIMATSLGILPGSFVFAYAGRQLGTINTLSEIVSAPVLMAFVFLALLALMPIVYQKFKSRTS